MRKLFKQRNPPYPSSLLNQTVQASNIISIRPSTAPSLLPSDKGQVHVVLLENALHPIVKPKHGGDDNPRRPAPPHA